MTHSLQFDGSFIGEFDFLKVIYGYIPCTSVTGGQKPPVMYAHFRYGDQSYPIILKRNFTGKPDQAIIDELKSLFGITKMGCHRIRLNGIAKKQDENQPWVVGSWINVNIDLQKSDYYIFRAIYKKELFQQLPSLENAYWIPSVTHDITNHHRGFFKQVKKILVFRELMYITNTKLEKILIKPYQGKYIPLSIDEMTIKDDKVRKLQPKKESFFFPKTMSRIETAIEMLGLTKEQYCDQIEVLRNTMTKIILKFDEHYVWLADDVANRLHDRVSVYFELQEDLDE